MASAPESSYIPYRLSTGLLSVFLMFSCSLPSLAAGETTAVGEPVADEPAIASADPLPPDGAEAIADAAPSPTSLLAVQPDATAPASSAVGMAVPWNGAAPVAMQPGQPYSPPYPGMTGAPPGAWVMVWLPYGTSNPPPGYPVPASATPYPGSAYPSPAYPAAGYPTAGYPTGAYPTGAYPAATYPTGAYPAAAYPTAAYPTATYPAAYQTPPYPGTIYSVPPYAVPPYAVAPPPYPGAPYAGTPTVAYGNPGQSAILAVPASPDSSGAMVPPPPTVPTLAAPVVMNSGVPSWAAAPTAPLLVSAPTVAPTGTVPAPPATLQEILPTTATTAAAPLVVTEPEGPLTEPTLDLQGLYVLNDGDSSARARLTGSAFLTPNILVGGTLDLLTGPALAFNTLEDGIKLTELYVAASIPDLPGLRFRLGQLDLTSYFDRNSFAKDVARDFFNDLFHTNPALIGSFNFEGSHPGGLVQWAITDDIALNAAAFSSGAGISDFALDGFAGEVGFRLDNVVLRGTFSTTQDTRFQGTGDRLQAYGINAEWFIPEMNLGVFGRYGWINNGSTGFSDSSYSLGVNAFDVFQADDRLGLGYGRGLDLVSASTEVPDALEVFYDFEIMPNIRLGFSLQQVNSFRETVAGFRIRGDLDLLPSLSD